MEAKNERPARHTHALIPLLSFLSHLYNTA